jgi:hypothetical protein
MPKNTNTVGECPLCHCPLDECPGCHPYDCRCARCVGMAAAIGAMNSDGSYFFSDDELFRLATEQKD